ncbi:MAG: hypothetical protein ACP5RF_03590 [Candidatus Micrarchaeia archaeon]
MEEIDISIKKDFENKLLERREVIAEALYAGGTPSREAIKEQVCKKLNLDPKLTVIVKVNPMYGVTKSDIILYSYKSESAMSVEPSFRQKRAEKKSGAAAKNKPEASNAEEKKEAEDSKAAQE